MPSNAKIFLQEPIAKVPMLSAAYLICDEAALKREAKRRPGTNAFVALQAQQPGRGFEEQVDGQHKGSCWRPSTD